jgi:hypothetical protein
MLKSEYNGDRDSKLNIIFFEGGADRFWIMQRNRTAN